MTLEELQKMASAEKQKQQNEFIDKILTDVEWLCEKANKRDYQPTKHEQETFKKIYSIIINMDKWF